MLPKKKLRIDPSPDEQTAKLYQKRSTKKKRSRPIGTITFGACINEKIPTNFYGFVYSITFSDGTFYIGMKSFEKGEAWQSYKSSSKVVKERLTKETATFRVLFYGTSKGELSYIETRELFLVNALANPLCLNENIAGRFFRKNVQKYRFLAF